MASFSIIVPIYNESNNINKLVSEIYDSLKKYKHFELIFVNDGSDDNTNDVLEKIKINFPITIVENKSNLGQSFSIWTGVKNSNHKTVVTLDGDGQNNPNDIPKLLEIYFSRKIFALVGGIRKKRKDSFLKIISSKIANKIRSIILNDDCTDTGCSLKVFDKDIFLSFPFFDGLHRFLPALFKGYGMNTFFIDVDHRSRISGTSKYGTLDRLYKGIIDIIRVKKIIRTYRLKNKDIKYDY